jgi:hypothetical protein
MPNTSGLDSQKLQSLGSIESLIHDWLYAGEIKCGWSEINWKSDDVLKIPCTDIQAAVHKHCKDKHVYKTPSLEEIGKKLKKIVNAERKQQRSKNKAIGREYIYIFPPLDEARQFFCNSQNLSEQHWSKDIEIEPFEEPVNIQNPEYGLITPVAKMLETWDTNE